MHQIQLEWQEELVVQVGEQMLRPLGYIPIHKRPKPWYHPKTCYQPYYPPKKRRNNETNQLQTTPTLDTQENNTTQATQVNHPQNWHHMTTPAIHTALWGPTTTQTGQPHNTYVYVPAQFHTGTIPHKCPGVHNNTSKPQYMATTHPPTIPI